MEAPMLTRLLLVLLLAKSHDPDSHEAAKPRLESLCHWIDKHLDEPITLNRLTLQAGCSSRTLQYHFQNHFGCTPMQWVRQLRLERALHQLQQNKQKQSIKSIAHACGYGNLSAFCRDFKQRYGTRASDVLAGATDPATSVALKPRR